MIKELTSLRFVFVILIFVHHLGLYSGGGTLAVAFFFVLSGYCMTLGYKDKILEPTFSYKNYFLRRIIKFYPLHWICLLATFPLLHASEHSLSIFSLNALLLQSFVPVRDVYFSYNAVSWFLSDILFFAIIFPLLGKFIFSSLRILQLFFVLTLAVIYVFLLVYLPQDMRHAIFYINPIIRSLDFIIGMYLALAYLWLRRQERVIKVVNYSNVKVFFIIALFIGISVLFSNTIPNINHLRCFAFLYWPLVAFVILFTSLSTSMNQSLSGGGKILQSQELLVLGTNTFVFFMTHLLVIWYYDNILGVFSSIGSLMLSKFLYYGGTSLRFVTCLFITIALSLVVEKYILSPLSQWITKNIQQFSIVRS